MLVWCGGKAILAQRQNLDNKATIWQDMGQKYVEPLKLKTMPHDFQNMPILSLNGMLIMAASLYAAIMITAMIISRRYSKILEKKEEIWMKVIEKKIERAADDNRGARKEVEEGMLYKIHTLSNSSLAILQEIHTDQYSVFSERDTVISEPMLFNISFEEPEEIDLSSSAEFIGVKEKNGRIVLKQKNKKHEQIR